MTDPWIWVVLFFIGVVYDVLYILFSHSVTTNRAHLCAVVSVVLTAMGTFSVKSVVSDSLLIVPQLTGVAVGTYLGMWFKKRLN